MFAAAAVGLVVVVTAVAVVVAMLQCLSFPLAPWLLAVEYMQLVAELLLQQLCPCEDAAGSDKSVQ